MLTGVLVAVGLVGAIAGVVQYAPVRPWRTPVGRHLAVYMLAVVALYALVTANLLAGHYPGRTVVTVAVAAILDAAVWWRWWLIWRTNKDRDRERSR